MRCILAPPHHFMVPSPYKQGESAIRIINSARFFLLSPFSFPLSPFPYISTSATTSPSKRRTMRSA